MKKLHNKTLKTGLQAKTAARRMRLAAAKSHDQAVASATEQINDLLVNLPSMVRKISELILPSKRLKQQDDELVGMLAGSMARDGQVHEILVWQNEVLDGVARVEAMQALGHASIKVKDLSHLPRAKAQRMALAVNSLAQRAEWDLDGLREQVISIESEGYEIDGIAFDAEQLDILRLDGLDDGPGALDNVPEVAEGEPVSREGDLWHLGRHRIYHGNALAEESYTALLGDETVQSVFTDQPYNVPIAGNVSGLGKVKHGEFVMASGEQSPEEFLAFLTTSLELMRQRLDPGRVAYACMDWRSIGLLCAAAAGAGFSLINMAVWDKGSGAMGALYRSAHELIAVLCNGDKPAVNNVKLGVHGRDRTNVWNYPGANRKGSSAAMALKDHPTPKSVELVADALLDTTERGDLVLDPFLGSGTTVVAAMETGRIARGMELDGKYVDVAILRWSGLTREEAILAATGETFSAVKARRAGEAGNQDCTELPEEETGPDVGVN